MNVMTNLKWVVPLLPMLLSPLTLMADTGTKKPNILFFLTDDQRPDTIHALGNEAIITPNLDALAEQGMAFDRAYCFGSACQTSRNSLFSGRAYLRYRRCAPDTEANIPQSMNEAGYETYHRGRNGRAGALLIHNHFQDKEYFPHHQAHKNGQPAKQEVDAAIEFLESRDSDKPFFMYLAPSEPHDPRNPADEYLDMYRRDEIPLPENYMPIHPFHAGRDIMTIRCEQVETWPRTKEKVRLHVHEYYAMITGLDYHFGRLIRKLTTLDLYDNTIIVFSSDQGLAVGSHGLMGKRNPYEHTGRVPLIIAGPGIPKGRRSDAVVSLMDLFPTFCELAGAPVPDGLDGVSFKPILDGKVEKVRDHVLTANGNEHRTIRKGDWKLIRFTQVNKTLLFNLKDDPHELNNLADDKKHLQRVADMTALIAEEQKRLGDTLPLTTDDPLPPAITAEQIQQMVDARYRKRKAGPSRTNEDGTVPPHMGTTMYQRELAKRAWMAERRKAWLASQDRDDDRKNTAEAGSDKR